MTGPHGMDPELREEFKQTALVHMEALYGFALRLTGRQAEAEDLVQEVFLKAYRAYPRFQHYTPCRNWLFKILYNAWISKLRKDARVQEIGEFDEIESICEAAQHEMDAVDERLDVETLSSVIDDRLKEALERLPERFRVVFLLSAIEGLSYAEIAQIVDVPLGTVMSRLYRARRMLKRELWHHAKTLGYIRDRKRGLRRG